MDNDVVKIYRVFYKLRNTDKACTTLVPVVGTDTQEMVEYAWRMSPANVPHTEFLYAERIK